MHLLHTKPVQMNSFKAILELALCIYLEIFDKNKFGLSKTCGSVKMSLMIKDKLTLGVKNL